MEQMAQEQLTKIWHYLTLSGVPFVTLENGSARPMSMLERVMEAMAMERRRGCSLASLAEKE